MSSLIETVSASKTSVTITDLVRLANTVSLGRFSGEPRDFPAFRMDAEMTLDGLGLKCLLYDLASCESVVPVSRMLSAALYKALPTMRQRISVLPKYVPGVPKVVGGSSSSVPTTASSGQVLSAPSGELMASGITAAPSLATNVASPAITRLSELAQHVGGLVLPCTIWGMVVNDFDRNTGMHRSALRMKMHGLRMTDNFQAFKTELEVVCCQLATMGCVIDEGEKLAVLFRGMVGNAAMAAALPECELLVGKGQRYDDVCAYLDMHCALRAAVSPVASGSMSGQRGVTVLAAEVSKRAKSSGAKCVGCGKTGHGAERCWRLHPEMRPASFARRKTDRVRTLKCFACGELGHKRAVCPNGKPKLAYPVGTGNYGGEAKAADSSRLVVSSPGPFTPASAPSGSGTSVAAFSIAPLRVASDASDDLFYIDTAADVHVCNDLRMFVTHQRMREPQAMYAYDGTGQEVSRAGTIWLRVIVDGQAQLLVLHDVVYNPHSQFNLLSEYLLSEAYNSKKLRSVWRFTNRHSGKAMLTAVRHNRRWAVVTNPDTPTKSGMCASPPQRYRALCVSSLNDQRPQQAMGVSASTGRTTPLVWHARLGHMSAEHMHLVVKHGLVGGMNGQKQFGRSDLEGIHACDVCLRCKSNKLPFRTGQRVYRASRCLERLWVDLSGRFPVASIDGEQYYLSVTDEFSHYVTVYLLTHKSEALAALKRYVEFWKARRASDQVLFLRSDNGGEFTSEQYKEWCTAQGIVIEYTVPGCPQQNGVSERINQTIMRPVRSMLVASHLPPPFWSFAVLHAVTILNMSPSVSVNHMTASELMIGRMPSVSSLRVFGCLAYYANAIDHPDKLAARSHRCVYLGIDSLSAGYVLWHIEWQAVVVGRHVRCVESVFPDPHPTNADVEHNHESMSEWLDLECEGRETEPARECTGSGSSLVESTQPRVEHAHNRAHDVPVCSRDAHNQPTSDESDTLPPHKQQSAAAPHDTSAQNTASALSPALSAVPTSPVSPASSSVPVASAGAASDVVNMRVPDRLRVCPVDPPSVQPIVAGPRRPVTRSQTRAIASREEDVVETSKEYRHLLRALRESEAEAVRQAGDGKIDTRPVQSHSGRDRVCAAVYKSKVEEEEDGPSVSLQSSPEPVTAADALQGPEAKEWRKAMQDELDSMAAHGVWSLVQLPKDRQVVSSRWVFKRKLKADGSVERFKARLVARGFEQRCGVNYEETWAPTALFKTYRLLLALSGHFRLGLYQLDVQSAYLNGALDEEVYMAMPDECGDGTDRVCKLQKAIYGLKQAARSWYEELSRALLKFGLSRCAHEPCMYYRVVCGHLQLVLIYVDDVCDATSDKALHVELANYLHGLYGVVDKGELHWFLNHTVEQTATAIRVHQQAYIDRVLVKFGIDGAHHASTPMDPGWRKCMDSGSSVLLPAAHARYRQIVGCLMYMAVATRPDVCYAVGECARHVAAPSESHMAAAVRILQYVSCTRERMLEFRKSTSSSVFDEYPSLTAYSDATWASDVDSMRSVTGFALWVGGSPVDWSSHMQPVVAGSSHDAELIALAACVADIKWFRGVLCELLGGVLGLMPVWKVFCDNKGAVESVYRGPLRQHKRVIGVKVAIVREAVFEEELSVAWCTTESNVADVFTKALLKTTFNRHGDQLVTDVPKPNV